MDAAQTYETTLFDRDSGRAFTFVVVPARSFAEPRIAEESSRAVAARLGFDVPDDRERGGLLFRTVPSYGMPFAIELTLTPDPRPGDWLRWELGMERLPIYTRDEPSPFAEYLAFSPVVPFESSPVTSKSLGDLAAAGGGIGGAIGAYATGHPLLLLAVPAGIIVCGAARGVSQALEIGLRAKLLGLMNVEDPGAPKDEPPPELPPAEGGE